MKKISKAKIIKDEFDRLYPNPQVPLNSKNHFTFLIAVLLSAQCTDKRVNEVTPKLFKLADSPQKMIKLSEEKIGEIIFPCGFWRTKSANIKKLSKILVEKYDSKVPHTFEELEALPGVGHKTASVMMIQVFNTPAFPVDTHIHRLSTRWGISSGKSVEETERKLKETFDEPDWAKLHLQFIYYGREYCKASTCKTPQTYCPLCKKLR